MRRAYRLHDNCDGYIFSSADETGNYLAQSLKWIGGIAPTLNTTTGKTTGTNAVFWQNAMFHVLVERAIP
jgi:hypothetical protein